MFLPYSSLDSYPMIDYILNLAIIVYSIAYIFGICHTVLKVENFTVHK